MSTQKFKSTTSIQHFDIIIRDIDVLIQTKQDFIGFIIIALGIEFLGSFYDSKKFDDFGESENRFKIAIKKLFKNKWYKNHSDWLFRHFRGPLIHQYRPSDQVYLTSTCKNKVPISEHLKKKDGKIILVIEKLYEDYKEAVISFINLSKKNNPLDKSKLNQEYTGIYTYLNPNIFFQFNDIQPQNFDVSGTTVSDKINNPSVLLQTSTKSKKKG